MPGAFFGSFHLPNNFGRLTV